MRSRTERRALLAGAALFLIGACTTQPSPSAPAESAATMELPDPGQPYGGPAILEAMSTSPRPDGVPAAVQTVAIADAIAAAIWTFDGEPWDTLVAGGACETTCSVEVAGTRAGAADEDLWTFAVDPAAATVAVEGTSLRAIPDEITAALDDLARRVATPAALDGMRLTSAAWTPPPDSDQFVLSYRSGGEEGSCTAELTVDARRGELVEESYAGC